MRGIRVHDFLPVIVSGAKLGHGEVPLDVLAGVHVGFTELGFPGGRHFRDPLTFRSSHAEQDQISLVMFSEKRAIPSIVQETGTGFHDLAVGRNPVHLGCCRLSLCGGTADQKRLGGGHFFGEEKGAKGFGHVAAIGHFYAK